jgi:hypothetical protein
VGIYFLCALQKQILAPKQTETETIRELRSRDQAARIEQSWPLSTRNDVYAFQFVLLSFERTGALFMLVSRFENTR